MIDSAQHAAATVSPSKTANNNVGEAFRDNLDLTNTGIRANRLTAPQRERLLALVGEYVGHMRDGHARVRMEEVRRHLDDTWFAWVGGRGAQGGF